MKRTEVALGWKSIPGYRHQVEGRENEDAVVVTTDHPLFDALMVVADGMGGHDEPKLAAETAAKAARDYLGRPELAACTGESGSPRECLRQALRHANQRVAGLGDRGGKRPGSTLTVAVIADGELHVAHAGDGSTMLLRDGRLRPLVGGEDRRLGNRPQEYLGHGAQLEIEEASESLAVGDRILICTDGLTRYFGQVIVGGGDGLREVLGRASADPQAIANQLTAHSRTDQYDDDTTVVVAEVVEMRTVSAPRRPVPQAAPMASGGAPLWRAAGPVALLSVVVLGAAWFALARWRPLGDGPAPASVAVSERSNAPAALRSLPKQDLILIDKAGRRFYVLRSQPVERPADPVELQAMRAGRDGLLEMAGKYRWDPVKRTLTDQRSKRRWSVALDADAGTLVPASDGVLTVTSEPAGGEAWINDALVGKTPVQVPMRSGPARVRVRWESGGEQSTQVTVPPGGKVGVVLGAERGP